MAAPSELDKYRRMMIHAARMEANDPMYMPEDVRRFWSEYQGLPGVAKGVKKGEWPVPEMDALDYSGLVPGLGDITGPMSDIRNFIRDPEQITPINVGLAAIGFLPFVGSLRGVKDKVVRRPYWHGTDSYDTGEATAPSKIIKEGFTRGKSAELKIPGTSLSEDILTSLRAFTPGSGDPNYLIRANVTEDPSNIWNLPPDLYAAGVHSEKRGAVHRKPNTYREAETFATRAGYSPNIEDMGSYEFKDYMKHLGADKDQADEIVNSVYEDGWNASDAVKAFAPHIHNKLVKGVDKKMQSSLEVLAGLKDDDYRNIIKAATDNLSDNSNLDTSSKVLNSIKGTREYIKKTYGVNHPDIADGLAAAAVMHRDSDMQKYIDTLKSESESYIKSYDNSLEYKKPSVKPHTPGAVPVRGGIKSTKTAEALTPQEQGWAGRALDSYRSGQELMNKFRDAPEFTRDAFKSLANYMDSMAGYKGTYFKDITSLMSRFNGYSVDDIAKAVGREDAEKIKSLASEYKDKLAKFQLAVDDIPRGSVPHSLEEIESAIKSGEKTIDDFGTPGVRRLYRDMVDVRNRFHKTFRDAAYKTRPDAGRQARRRN